MAKSSLCVWGGGGGGGEGGGDYSSTKFGISSTTDNRVELISPLSTTQSTGLCTALVHF